MKSFPLIIGLIGAFLTTFSFLPQSIKAIKTKHTKDLSLITLLMADTGVIAWLIYGLFINDFPIIAANSVSFLVLSLTLYLKITFK